MGLGNGLDEAPPGVTEDQPHYEERVEGAGDSDESGASATQEVMDEPVAETGVGDLEDSNADASDASDDVSGGQGKQWGRVEDGPDQGKGGDQEIDSDDSASVDAVDKGGPKGNMGLGNGLDEAPPGVTEDQPRYDERVEGAGDESSGDDALETDFFLMDGDDSDSGSSWTELTEGEDSLSGTGAADSGNGWTEEVESDDDEGRGKGRGKKGGDDEGDSFEGSDNLDAFENEAEDFPDQSDW